MEVSRVGCHCISSVEYLTFHCHSAKALATPMRMRNAAAANASQRSGMLISQSRAPADERTYSSDEGISSHHTDSALIRQAPFTRYNLLSNQIDNRLNVCIHDTTGCQTGLTAGLTTGCIVYTAGCQTGCTTRFDNRLNEQWLFVQHGCQTGCQAGFRLSSQFDNQFDNRLYIS